jgi:drug/metabolite transporter (DMT)-like permease
MTLYWVLATIIGAAGLTTRNAMQRNLTQVIGTVGATQVRFLYGLPFSVIFLAISALITGHAVPALNATMLGFSLSGAVSQIIATALMLLAMRERSFSVTTAYTKTEPVQVAIFSVVVLGDKISILAALAIITATIGVILMAVKPGDGWTKSGLRPVAYGIVSGTFFALSSVSFRGGILALNDTPFLLAASTTLVTALSMQTAILLAYMALFNRSALMGSFTVWRASLLAGFVGAFASQAWFIGFSLTTAANIRTLGLVEMIFAQIITRRVLKEQTVGREWIGMALILAGVAALLAFG